MRRFGPRAAVASWLLLAAGAALGVGPSPAVTATPAGPPFPPPTPDIVVYDEADIFSPMTEAAAARIILAIEQRVGAEVVVYSQHKPGATTSSTERDAMALMDQWAVGRAGFDDGLVILFNMTRRACQPGVPGNGQVQLYAGPGYRAAYLSNAERQHIFDNEMLPLLGECQLDGALLVALRRIDENATPEHARLLESARFIDAAVGLIGAPLVLLLVIGAAGGSWLLYGRDPVYLDSPSILMPAPPPALTAAAGALIWEGRTTRRALTTALLDLASRGEMSFRPEKKLLSETAGIQVIAGTPDDPYTLRNRRRPLSRAEKYLLGRLNSLAGRWPDRYITADELAELAVSVPKFNEQLEKFVTSQGWFREPPRQAVRRWRLRATGVLSVGALGVGAGLSLPSGGFTMLGVALLVGGGVVMLIAGAMPARTMAGAVVYAMLAAYRRTLHRTMEQARSMREVVEQAQLDWLETPDQALVWGVALGLQREVEDVLERSADDARVGVLDHNPWLPAWYGSADSGSISVRPGAAPGLFSPSALPNFGGMMATLGTIGASGPASSGSGGGGSGGFSGGSSGGGGGGAGGGF